MVKKTIYPGTQGRKNKVLKGHIDLTGINKVPIVGLWPVGKSPTSYSNPLTTDNLKIIYNPKAKLN